MSENAASNTEMIGKVVLGRYRILRHLADGGMGAIYLARSEGAGGFVRPVVIKSVLPSHIGDTRMVDLFMREARIMSNLRHPGIVSVIDFAQEGQSHFMVLDYVHGFHLGRWHKYIQQVKHEKFPAELAIYIVLNVLRALQYAHTLRAPDGSPLNIVHRDVTPSNVLVDVQGHVKLADFGIAQMNTERTEVGKRSIKGKFPYLAPEILENHDPSPASDVYSAGLVLHELLVDRNEFAAKGMPAIVSRVLKHVPTPVDELRDDIPAGLGPIISKALEKEQAKRYSTAAEFAEALSNVRRMSEDEAAKQLATVAAADFRDPRMAAFLSVPELDALESDWRTPASTIDDLTDPDVGVAEAVGVAFEDTAAGLDDADDADDAPARATAAAAAMPEHGRPSRKKPETLDRTVAQSPAALGGGSRKTSPGTGAGTERSAPPAAARSRWPIAVGAVALAGIGALALVALLKAGNKDRAPQEPAYIVMDDRRDPNAKPPSDPPADPPPTAPTADAGAGAVVTPLPQDPPPRDDPPRQLTEQQRLARAFAKQTAKIAGCFEQHAVDVSGSPEMSIRFEVEEDGTISTAELSPSSLRSTALGTCIEKVARATKFGRQEKSVRFRVPLKARVRP